MKFKKILLTLLLFSFSLGLNANTFANNTTASFSEESYHESDEVADIMSLTCITLVDSNMWLHEEGFYAQNAEVVTVIPMNTKILVAASSQTTNYVFAVYVSDGELFYGYMSKDNLRLY